MSPKNQLILAYHLAANDMQVLGEGVGRSGGRDGNVITSFTKAPKASVPSRTPLLWFLPFLACWFCSLHSSWPLCRYGLNFNSSGYGETKISHAATWTPVEGLLASVRSVTQRLYLREDLWTMHHQWRRRFLKKWRLSSNSLDLSSTTTCMEMISPSLTCVSSSPYSIALAILLTV